MSLLPAFLTAFLFALSIQCAGRSTKMLGSTLANYVRLLVALACLAAYSLWLGQGWQGPGFYTLLLSGAIGIGIGDFCTFQSLRKISPGLAVLVVQCFCAPVAAFIEWIWLGTALTVGQIVGIAVILSGMTLSLGPGIRISDDRRGMLFGISLAMGGAVMQAIGAVLTRDAHELNVAAGVHIDGLTAGYQRMCGAFVVMTAVFLFYHFTRGRAGKQNSDSPKPWKKAMPWVVGNAVFGLVLGIGCFQWALMSIPSAVALSIVALTPLLAMPIAWIVDGERPKLLSVLGGAIAVGGVIILKWV